MHPLPGGDCTHQATGHLSCSDLGSHKTQAQPSLRLCGEPENQNLSGSDLGRTHNPGPASDSSWQINLEHEQCRLGKHRRHERGKPSVTETLRALPTHASDICLQYSSLPTEGLNN